MQIFVNLMDRTLTFKENKYAVLVAVLAMLSMSATRSSLEMFLHWGRLGKGYDTGSQTPPKQLALNLNDVPCIYYQKSGMYIIM